MYGEQVVKALIRSYVFWPNMDKEIEENVKYCWGCVIAAKAPPVKFTPWLKIDELILDRVMSDNATQFMPKEFKDFCKALLIVHITTAPYHL